MGNTTNKQQKKKENRGIFAFFVFFQNSKKINQKRFVKKKFLNFVLFISICVLKDGDKSTTCGKVNWKNANKCDEKCEESFVSNSQSSIMDGRVEMKKKCQEKPSYVPVPYSHQQIRHQEAGLSTHFST